MPRPGREGSRLTTFIISEKTIRGVMGDQAIVVFLPGAAGDVTQVDNRSPYRIRQFGEVSGRFVGGRVGAEAVKVLLAMEQGTEPLGPLAAESRMLRDQASAAVVPNIWPRHSRS